MECCYGDACERLPVALVKCKHCDADLHHLCQTKYEFTYGLDSDMVYICRVCIDKKYRDVIEKAKASIKEKVKAKPPADDDSDCTVSLFVNNVDEAAPKRTSDTVVVHDNAAADNAVMVIDAIMGAGVAATSEDAASEEKADDIIQAAAAAR